MGGKISQENWDKITMGRAEVKTQIEKVLNDSQNKSYFIIETVCSESTLFCDDKAIEIGEPTISGAKVEADLIKNSKNRTVLIFKKRRRKNSRRKNGHRQQYSLIRINKIFSKDGKLISEAEKIKKETKEIKQEKKESAK